MFLLQRIRDFPILRIAIVCLILLSMVMDVQADPGSDWMNPQQMQQTIDRLIALESRRKNQSHYTTWIKTLDEQGCWPDIDYAQKRRAHWQPMNHTSRLRELAIAYYDMKSDDPVRKVFKDTVIRGLDSWLKMKLESPNWWHNEIGVPEFLAVAALSLGDALPSSTRDGLVALLKKHVKIGMTGANKVWLSRNVFMRGLLEGNRNDVQAGIDSIQAEIYVSTNEGIQPDMSFHQHGPILMSNSYGLAFLSANLQLMSIVHDTDVAFNPENKAIVTNMLLDGTGLMTFKGQSCPASMGRSSTRKGALRRNLSGYFRRLLTCDPPRHEALKTKLDIIEGKQPEASLNRMFFSSDMMIHQRPDWQVSIKLFSNRMYNSDGPVNSEGLKNGYMSHGSAFLLRGDDEYVDLPGAWDWQHLPGTTVGLSPTYHGKLKGRNGSAFAGGVSDGKFGAAGFELDSNGLSAQLAWFCFEEGYIVMGSDLKHDKNLPIVTTYDQCKRKTPVWVADANGKAKQLSDDASGRLDHAKSVWHDNVVYANLGQSITHLGSRLQTGNWGDINITYKNTPDVQANVFRAWLEHTDGNFAYAVYPDVSVKQAQDKAESTQVQIIHHDSQRLAVYHTRQKVGMAIFFAPGQVSFSTNLNVAVDQPLAVMVSVNPQGGYDLTVASPSHDQTPVMITCHGKTRTIALPTGLMAGNSMTIHWP